MCFSIQWTLGKHFLPPAGYGSIFPAKSCRDAWRSGSWLVRGQVNTADEAKLCSPIRSTFEALMVWREVWRCHGEELGPLCWPVPAAGIAVFGASHWFAEHASQMWWFCWDSESCRGSNRQQTSKQCLWPFGASLALRSALELLSPTTELIIAGSCIKSTLYCMSQSNWEMVHCCIEEEKMTLQNDNYFDFWSAHEVPTYQVFHLSNLLQIPNDCGMVHVEFSSSFSCSCQLTMTGHCASHFQASCLLCKTSWTTTALHIC